MTNPRTLIGRKSYLVLSGAIAAAVAGFTLPRGGVAAPSAKAPSAATTKDWPQFRGPGRDDVSTETGLLKAWEKDGPKLVWNVKGLGKGFSTVAVVGGRIYSMGEDDKKANSVIALDAADGKKLWSTPVGKGTGGGGYPGTRCTPTVDLAAGRLYALGDGGELVCLELADGKEVWRKSLTKDFGGGTPGWGYAESPLVDGDRVIVTPGGKKGTLVALDKKTGATLWQSTDWTDGAQYSSVIAIEHGGVRQYVQLTMKTVAGVAADSGKVLWQAEFPGSTAVITTPVFLDGTVYVTCGYGVGSAAYKVAAEGGGKFTATKLYHNKVIKNHHGGVVQLGGKIYGHSDSSGWTCQDMVSGKELWQTKKDAVGKGAITYADGRFYLREEDSPGRVALIEATPEGYKEHGRFEPPDRIGDKSWAHPVIANGKLYLRDQDVLLCYDVKGK